MQKIINILQHYLQDFQLNIFIQSNIFYMQFNQFSKFVILLKSTMSKENFRKICGSAFSYISDKQRQSFQQHNLKEREDYLDELLSLQIHLNQVLKINNILTDQFIKNSEQLNGKTSSSQGSTLASGVQKMNSFKNELRPHDIKINQKKKIKRTHLKMENQYSYSEYEPSQDEQILIQYKLSQSKNVPKNYGKAILNFIKKNQGFARKVLSYLHQDFANFEEFLKKFKNNINTIAQLRSLWLEQKGNIYAKALRIITMQYLRKFSLSHIFNSRVENFGKHIKYRQKITKAVARPQQFTHMKDY